MHPTAPSRLTPLQNAGAIIAVGSLVMLAGFLLPWNAPNPCLPNPGYFCLGAAIDGLVLLQALPLALPAFIHGGQLFTFILPNVIFLLTPILLALCGIATMIFGVKAIGAARFQRVNAAQLSVAVIGLIAIIPVAGAFMATGPYPNAFDDLGLGIYTMFTGFLIALGGGIYARLLWHKDYHTTSA